jgi:hypothetical protein
MPETMPNKALYYPHLEFGSAAWVKSALLYWEGLVRFVGEVEPNDEPEIRELVSARLIEPIAFEPFRPQVKRLFGERFAELIRQRGGLPDTIPRARGLRADIDLDAKLLEELAQELESQRHREASEVIRTMPEQALVLAATFAAHVIASERSLSPVTDDCVFAAIDTYFAEEGMTSEPKAAPGGLAEADLLIPSPSVDAVASLPVERLLEVRDKLRSQRRSFRRKVERLRAAIAELPTVEAVREQLEAFAADIRDDLDAERQAMREAKVKDDWTFMTITAPAALAVGVTIAGSSSPVLGPIAGVGAVALGVTNWYVQRRKKREASGNYLLSLKTELGPEGRGLTGGLDQLLSE